MDSKNIKDIIKEKLEEGFEAVVKANAETEDYNLENDDFNVDFTDVWALKAGKTVKLTITTDEELGYKESVREDFSKTLQRGIVGTVVIDKDYSMNLDVATYNLNMDNLLKKIDGKKITLKIEECNPEDVKKDEEELGGEEFELF